MTTELKTIPVSVRGRLVDIPCRAIGGVNVITSSGWLKAAAIHQEDWLAEPIADPDGIVAVLTAAPMGADYFTFSQLFTDTRPRHSYHYELDNIAAIPILSYQDWWDNRVSADLRKDIRRAEKRGVTTRVAEFNDEFVRGIKEIYDEVPVRQGRPFWHYKKELSRVKAENSSFHDRSVFLGAYGGEELIGFIKIVRCAGVARMMQIISKEAHFEKRPANALIAAAVKWAHDNGFKYLTYGRYTYDSKRNSTVVQFKRRNGFEEVFFPRYYVPLSRKGALALPLGIHRGFRRFVPERLIEVFKAIRLKQRLRRAEAAKEAASQAS